MRPKPCIVVAGMNEQQMMAAYGKVVRLDMNSTHQQHMVAAQWKVGGLKNSTHQRRMIAVYCKVAGLRMNYSRCKKLLKWVDS